MLWNMLDREKNVLPCLKWIFYLDFCSWFFMALYSMVSGVSVRTRAVWGSSLALSASRLILWLQNDPTVCARWAKNL